LWGLPFKQFPPSMYYVYGSTYRMNLSQSNEQYCLFKSVGSDICWLFDFPVGNGHVVALPFTYDSEEYYFGTRRAAAFLTAACGVVLEEKAFPKTGTPILVQPYKRDPRSRISYRDWNNLIFDVAIYGDPYVWRTNSQFYTMQNYFNADTAVLHNFDYWGQAVFKKDAVEERGEILRRYYPDLYANGNYYSAFVYNGGNLVFWGNAYGAADLLSVYLGVLAGYDYNDMNNNITAINPLYGAFQNLPTELPYTYYHHSTLNANPDACLFAIYENGTLCHVWSSELGSNNGFFTFISWEWTKSHHADALESDYAYRYLYAWPNPVWRTVFAAALDPDGSAVNINQRFDEEYMRIYSRYSPVGMLFDPSRTDYADAVNVYQFLEYSGHPILLLNNYYDYNELAYILNVSTAFIIPNSATQDRGERDLQQRRQVGTFVSMLQSFMNNGSQVVVLGDNVALFNDLAGTFFTGSYPNADLNYSDYFYLFGYDFYSRPNNGLFSYYFRENRTLPAWGLYSRLLTEQILARNPYSLDNYCAYGFEGYCALWSKTYGSDPDNGELTFMSTQFEDNRRGGAKSSFVNAAPWVRALNIAIEGRQTPTPSTTPLPSISPLPSLIASPSQSPLPSLSPAISASPVASPSSSLSSTISPTESPSISESSTASPTLSTSSSTTSTVSETPTRSAIPAGPEDIPSLVPAPPSPSASLRPSIPATATPSNPQISVPGFEDCQDCDVGSVRVFTEGSGDGPTVVDITLPGGELIGTVVIPPTFISSGYVAMDITFVTNLPQRGNIERGNTILDINLYDEFGNSIHELPDPLEICIAEEADEDDACLGYYDVTNREWICEDECLKRENDSYCGETDHLTNFAVLLGGSGGGRSGGDPCESYSPNYLFAWLSLAAVALACCCIIVGILAVEMKMRKKQYNHHRSFRNMSRTVQKNM